MVIFVTGGTGFVGQALTGLLAESGHELLILTRSKRPDQNGIRFIKGDPIHPGPWQETAAGADAVVNLAGASIFQRWTKNARKTIIDSRIQTTRNLVEAMTRNPKPGRVFLSTSAVGYYGDRGDEELAETAGPGDGFLADLSVQWEKEAMKAEEAGARVCRMRFGVVLGRGGGALGKMLPLFKLGLGGRLGSGRQWFSWIHIDDLARAVLYLIERDESAGVFNFTAPGPVTNAEFTKALGRAVHRPAILPAPAFMMKLFLGEFSSTLLSGQRVVPKKLLETGFKFAYPRIDQALDSLSG